MSDEGVLVAIPELRRMAPDALRMSGIPLGQADESAEMLVWTEAVVGGALRFLRLNRARMLRAPRPKVVVSGRDSEATTLHAQGGSLLEYGVRIFDFARGEAATTTTATLRVDDTYGSLFLQYLTWRTQVFGYEVSATAVDPMTGATLEPDPAEQWATVRIQITATEPPARSPALSDPAGQPAPFRRALTDGIHLDAKDFTAFAQFFEMLRVPTSERSRSHAG